MSSRALTLAISLLAMSLLGFATGCDSIECASERATIDLGIETDLHAVVNLDHWSGERHVALLAAGADGTVVAWGMDYGGKQDEPIVEVFDLGDAHLRAVWVDKSTGPDDGSHDGPWNWWVVGDGGRIMVSSDQGTTWDSVELQSDANLYGIAGIDGRPIVVGDDIIATRTFDGTWTELTPPADGWGQLRGVFAQDTRVEIVGLGGVIWSTTDPSGEWTLEPSGVTTDLFAVDYDVAVGAEGTLLVHSDTGWMPSDTGVDVDLIDYEGGYALGANGEIYEVTKDEPLSLVQTNPGARALTNSWYTWATVGDGGSMSSPPVNCY
jgi:hypothetical protein